MKIGETNMLQAAIGLALLIVLAIVGLFWGVPQYSVYTSKMAGIAELRQAEYSKQVKIQESLAKQEAAQYEAEAEVIRSRGVSQANKIIGESLTDSEPYLRYLFINALNENKGEREIVYIPTEAGLPILEAGRHSVK